MLACEFSGNLTLRSFCRKHSSTDSQYGSSMDSLDSRLLRARFRDGVFALPGIDPRRTVVELAKRCGSSRLTVRRRLRQWVKSGFWGPITVFPNPDALGCAFYFQGFAVEGARFLARLETEVARSPNVAFLFQVADFYGVVEVTKSLERLPPLQHRLERLQGVRTMFAPVRIAFPPSRGELRPRDVRIVAALRRLPAPDWERVSADVGMTVHGLRRRISQLLDSDQLFFFPELDFRKSHGSVALVTIFLLPGTSEESIRKSVHERFPDYMELENIFPHQTMIPPSLQGPYQRGASPGAAPPVARAFCCFVALKSAAEGDELHREFASIPGVYEPLILYPIRSFAVPRWVDAWTARKGAAA